MKVKTYKYKSLQEALEQHQTRSWKRGSHPEHASVTVRPRFGCSRNRHGKSQPPSGRSNAQPEMQTRAGIRHLASPAQISRPQRPGSTAAQLRVNACDSGDRAVNRSLRRSRSRRVPCTRSADGRAARRNRRSEEILPLLEQGRCRRKQNPAADFSANCQPGNRSRDSPII